MEAKLTVLLQQILGEGPVWHAQEKKVYWLDILNGHLYRADEFGKQLEQRQFPFHIGCMAILENGHLLLCTNKGLFTYEFEQHEYKQIISDFQLPANLRCNDGKVSDDGDLWFGTMQYEPNQYEGTLYRLNTKGELAIEKQTVTIPNGLAWYEGGVYFVDSGERTLYRVSKKENGYDWANAEPLYCPEDERMTPDGMTIDAEGNLWIAIWGGSKVIHFNPETKQIFQEISVPAPYVTSCTFVGDSLQKLWITTAISDLTEEQRVKYPLAGSIFTAEVNVKGKECRILKGGYYENR